MGGKFKPRRLIRRHKELLTKAGYNPEEWQYMWDSRKTITFYSKKDGSELILEK